MLCWLLRPQSLAVAVVKRIMLEGGILRTNGGAAVAIMLCSILGTNGGAAISIMLQVTDQAETIMPQVPLAS